MSHTPQQQQQITRKQYRGHFDGKTIIVDEPMPLAAGEKVLIQHEESSADHDEPKIHQLPPEQRAAALDELFKSLEGDVHVPPEQWTRGSFYYEDDQR